MRWYLDMDPGIDDAVALAVALARGPVAGLTTVAGNVQGPQTFRNARRLLRAFGRSDLPVVAGAEKPLFHPLVTAPHIHGESGLEGYVLPDGPDASDGTKDAPISAWQWMGNALRHESEGNQVWVATGPLTNVARFLAGCADADLRQRVAAITVMGGSLVGGNVTPAAEFNFYCDPDAADFVLASGWPVRVVGLDVTTRRGIAIGDLPRLASYGRVGEMLRGWLTFYGEAIARYDQAQDQVHLHDVLAVAAAAHPERFSWQLLPLGVVRDGERRGAVVRLSAAGGRAPVEFAVGFDEEWFLEWFWQSLEAYRDAG